MLELACNLLDVLAGGSGGAVPNEVSNRGVSAGVSLAGMQLQMAAYTDRSVCSLSSLASPPLSPLLVMLAVRLCHLRHHLSCCRRSLSRPLALCAYVCRLVPVPHHRRRVTFARTYTFHSLSLSYLLGSLRSNRRRSAAPKSTRSCSPSPAKRPKRNLYRHRRPSRKKPSRINWTG